MCGIAGFIGLKAQYTSDDLTQTIEQMTNTLKHRGPDDHGVWVDKKNGIALGHRRLSILDLSQKGHQPMASASGRYVITYNGEIYNYRELKHDLERAGCAPAWRGHSDTEVLLAVIETYGIEKSLQKLNGMFAFALWDKVDKVLYLSRDRFGKKPLYYGWLNSTFIFASELKALQVYQGFAGLIDRDAVSLYTRFGYIPTPYSIYENIRKLPQASFLKVLPFKYMCKEEPVCYWSLLEVAEHGVRDKFLLSEEEIVLQLESLLMDAVKIRMESDVPLGAFLSGGIDSSMVAALMQAQSSQKIRTFSIGFYEYDYNEAHHAKAVGSHIGTDHTELYVTPAHALEVIPRIPEYYDEPFSDSSQIPTYLISEMTKRYVTVALSGDGGDEVFAGYSRYLWGQTLWTSLNRIPYFLRQGLAKSIYFIKPAFWDRLFSIFPENRRIRTAGIKMKKIADTLIVKDPVQMYKRMVSVWPDPESILAICRTPKITRMDEACSADFLDITEHMQLIDMITYLPDDILTKVDRASMAVSLEVRAPLLDYRLAEFSWRLPVRYKIFKQTGKWLLRKILYKYVPRKLLERPKMGFGVPIDSWLKDPLQDWVENLIDERRLKKEGFFNPAPIRKAWIEHISGKQNRSSQLWNILMFQAWLEKNGYSQ